MRTAAAERRASGGHLVEEAGHAVEAAVVAEGRHVEADRDRLAALGAELPGEAGHVVVGVDGPRGTEHQAGELLLRGADERVDRVASSATPSGST